MSEYWKSTPKYWCKHCSTYVKDTKFERSQHEATGKHQGNLKRFLRGIQNGQEKDEREKQRAKAEVERLNKVVGSSSTLPAKHDVSLSRKPGVAIPAPQVSAAERKKQVLQLAEMGIAIPDEFRGDMALAGEWQVVSQRPLEGDVPTGQTSIGVRKRKHENQEEGDEEEEDGNTVGSKGWGSTTRRYPGRALGDNTDLDALLSGNRQAKKEEPQTLLKEEPVDSNVVTLDDIRSEAAGKAEDSTLIEGTDPKLEDTDKSPGLLETASAAASSTAEPVFKKRKPRNMGSK